MKWVGQCMLAALAVMSVAEAGRTLTQSNGGKKRVFYLAANVALWDYAPSGINVCQGRNFSDSEALYVSEGIGSKAIKARFERFLDAKFTRKEQKRPAEEQHLGILGPLLRAEVGDTMEVHVFNNLTFPINVIPGGVSYGPYDSRLQAAPGKTAVYTWTVPAQAGPSASSNSTSTVWLYRSILDQQAHANAGLFGPIIITRKGAADAAGRPKDVDHEFISLFEVLDELNTPYLGSNQQRYGGETGFGSLTEDDFGESCKKHTINGFLWCNGPGFNMTTGSKVRWHTVAQGNEVDIHNVHWHGIVQNNEGTHADQFNMLPSHTVTAELVTDNPGTWLLHCHVNAHFSKGMQAFVTLAGRLMDNFVKSGVTRTYYIQAEESKWNYAPSGGNQCTGQNQSFTSDEALFLEKTPENIGAENIKARFVEYTDATFKTPQKRTAAEVHLGMLGPVIRAEVGDEVVVVFSNKARFPTTIHVHGLLYAKDSEGSPYADGTSGLDKADDGVPTGGNHTYHYQVPERAGPGPAEPSSKLWMYHSHADEAADTYAGLMGAVVVSRRGTSRADGTPLDVDREFVLFFSVMNEAASFLFVANLNAALNSTYVGTGLPEVHSSNPAASANNTVGGDLASDSTTPQSVEDLAEPGSALAALLANAEFEESNLKHSINGFMYCNLPGLEAAVGQRVRFYVMSLGDEVDLHTPNLESATLDWQGQSSQSLFFLPGNMETADAQLTKEGRWLLECRTADHVGAGMQALFVTRGADGEALAEAPARYLQPEEVEGEESPDTPSDPSADFDDGPGATPQAQVALDSSASAKSSQPNLTAHLTAAEADGDDSTTLPAVGTAAIGSDGILANSNARAFSAAAAGSSSIPLMGLAFSIAQSVRNAFTSSGVELPTLASVAKDTPRNSPIARAVQRTYYIQAEQLVWNFAPDSMDRCSGADFEDDQELYTVKMNNTLGPEAYKGMYRGYTDSTFTTRLPHSKWLGILGPNIFAQVGDNVKVVFRNKLTFPVNLFLDGGLIPLDTTVAQTAVQPGNTTVYEWQVPSESGPGADDPSTVHYMYHSTADLVPHMYAGMVGVVVVAKQGTLTAENTIPGIDTIMPLLFQVWDESKSVYFQANIEHFNPEVDQGDPGFVEGNLKHGINGYIFCNMPDVRVQKGKTVRWLFIGGGTENDMHSPIFNGQVLTYDHQHTGSMMLFPAITRTADMVAVTPGIHQYYCDVQDHLIAGMRGRLVVTK